MGGICINQHRCNQRAKTKADHLFCAEAVDQCAKENINNSGGNVPTAIVNGEKAALEQMYANIARQTELLEKLANK